jgi:hypothetical protein
MLDARISFLTVSIPLAGVIIAAEPFSGADPPALSVQAAGFPFVTARHVAVVLTTTAQGVVGVFQTTSLGEAAGVGGDAHSFVQRTTTGARAKLARAVEIDGSSLTAHRTLTDPAGLTGIQ